MRFIHCSDLHLGTTRFGNQRLTGDFSRAFRHMAGDAVRRNVDAVIISGDIFNRSGADLLTLHEAEKTMEFLRDSGAEIIAIEGEHDTCSCGNRPSWLRFLAHRGLVKLLDAQDAERRRPKAWSEESKNGSYIDIEGVRFCGLDPCGPGSGLDRCGELIEPADHTVAMLHAGIDGGGMGSGGIRPHEVEMLREKVDYLALGHYHGMCSIDGWIHNPGGLENWRPEECARRKGYFVVDVHGAEAEVEAVDSVRRPGHLVNIDVSGLNGDAEVNKAIKLALKEADIDPATEPIVSVDLVGRPRFDLSRYDGGSMCSWIISLTGAVECLINDRTRSNPAVVSLERPADRRAIEEVIMGTPSRLTPEEMSDLMLRYRSEPRTGGYEGVGPCIGSFSR